MAMIETLCKKCKCVATCKVNDEPLCESHGLYWSAVKQVPMVRFLREGE